MCGCRKFCQLVGGPDVTFFSHQRMAQRAVRTSLVSAVGSSKAGHCHMRENTTPVFARDQIDFPRQHNKWCILLITFLGLNIFYSWYMYNSLKQYANGSHVAYIVLIQCEILCLVLPARSEGDLMFCLQSHQRIRIDRSLVLLKDIEIWAIILVPLIMTLSRGHTGQIKRKVIMGWLWLPYRGNKVAP